MASTLLFEQLNDDLKRECDLAFVEYDVLVRLSESDQHTLRMAQLADAVCLSRSRMTHTIQRMEDRGLVTRSIATDDRRGILATLTERGFEVLSQAAPTHVAGVRGYLVQNATPEDLEALGRVMEAVTFELIKHHPEVQLRDPRTMHQPSE